MIEAEATFFDIYSNPKSRHIRRRGTTGNGRVNYGPAALWSLLRREISFGRMCYVYSHLGEAGPLGSPQTHTSTEARVLLWRPTTAPADSRFPHTPDP